jgi:hypothetical protein
VGPNIYRRQGIQWTKLLDAEVGRMYQNATNNNIAVGRQVWRFNGVDWKAILTLPSMSGAACYSDGKEILMLTNDNWKTIVFHGK